MEKYLYIMKNEEPQILAEDYIDKMNRQKHNQPSMALSFRPAPKVSIRNPNINCYKVLQKNMTRNYSKSPARNRARESSDILEDITIAFSA